MKIFRLTTAVLALACAFVLSGCSTAPDSRTSLTGELCIAGFCISPQAAAQAPQPLYNAIPGGSTEPVVTAPVLATTAAPAVVATRTYQATFPAPEPLPPPVSYNSPVVATAQTVVSAPASPPVAVSPPRYLEK